MLIARCFEERYGLNSDKVTPKKKINLENNENSLINKILHNIEKHLHPFLEIIYNNNSLTAIYNNFKHYVNTKPKYKLFFII